MIKQPHIKYIKGLTKVKLSDLKVGLEFVVIGNDLTETELRTLDFYIQTVREQGEDELLIHYEEYKRVIKRFTNEGIYYFPEIKEIKKVPKEETKAKPSLGLFDLK